MGENKEKDTDQTGQESSNPWIYNVSKAYPGQHPSAQPQNGMDNQMNPMGWQAMNNPMNPMGWQASNRSLYRPPCLLWISLLVLVLLIIVSIAVIVLIVK